MSNTTSDTRTPNPEGIDLRTEEEPQFYDQEHHDPRSEPVAAAESVSAGASVIDLFGDQQHRTRPGAPGPEPGHDDEGPIADDPDVLLEEAIFLVAEARALPMSTTVKVNRDDLLDLLEAARECLPTELDAARVILRRRDEVVEQARQEAAEILDEALHRAGRLVERTEVVRAAESRARQIVQEARTEAGDLRARADDYCEHRLADFAEILDRTVREVAGGRAKLAQRANPEHVAGEPVEPDERLAAGQWQDDW